MVVAVVLETAACTQMSLTLGVPGQPSGHEANAQSASATRVPNGIAGPLGRGESLSTAHSSACAAALLLETAGKLLNALLPLSGKVVGLPPLKLRSPNSVRMRSLIGLPVFLRDRKVDRQPIVSRRDVGAPTDPGQHIAALHQEAVTEIGRCARRVHVGVGAGVVHAAERDLASAIVDFEEQRAAALCSRSTGLRITISAENSTRPRSLRGALSRSNTTALRGSVGSTSK